MDFPSWTHNLDHPSVAHGVQIFESCGSMLTVGLRAVCTMNPGKGLSRATRLIAAAPHMHDALVLALARLEADKVFVPSTCASPAECWNCERCKLMSTINTVLNALDSAKGKPRP